MRSRPPSAARRGTDRQTKHHLVAGTCIHVPHPRTSNPLPQRIALPLAGVALCRIAIAHERAPARQTRGRAASLVWRCPDSHRRSDWPALCPLTSTSLSRPLPLLSALCGSATTAAALLIAAGSP
ncbi:uncharacterized protein TrAFT101_001953 [Trichoderma asperellum]|uniref:uncharacterized protein n=1 Tax=Trichoderma asperellum TaxID=101201 RepID=UPI00332CC1FA|nr:hypothetical protein TrAFT101_001953 [Trichoderma asperellum]